MSTSERCPLCKLAMPAIGRVISGRDDTGQHFCFGICPVCSGRVNRLPTNLRLRQFRIAIHNLAKIPDLCKVTYFNSGIEAKIFCKLEAERLTGLLPSV